jgi:hypothetical protein
LETAAAYDPTVTGTDQIYYFGDVTAGNTLKVDNIGSFSGRQRILRQRHHRPGLPTRGRDTGSQHRDERPEPGE